MFAQQKNVYLRIPCTPLKNNKNMKYILYYVAILFCYNFLQASNECIINYRIINVEKGNTVEIQSTQINKKLKKSGVLFCRIAEPEKAVIIIRNPNNVKTLFVWLEEGNYSMNIDIKSQTITTKNSLLNDIYFSLKRIQDSLRAFEKPLFILLRNDTVTKNKRDEVLMQIDSIENVIAEYQYNYYLQNPNSFLILDFLQFHIGNHTFNNVKLSSLLFKLSDDLKKYNTYKLCKEALNYKRIYTVGDTIPTTIFNTQNNTKYIYIDFWYSECKGSRINHKQLLEVYKQLADKIDIISISDNTLKDVWLNASKQDKIKWTNLCDFKGSLSPYKIQFNIKHLPTGILISPDGKIIKDDFTTITTEELSKYM